MLCVDVQAGCAYLNLKSTRFFVHPPFSPKYWNSRGRCRLITMQTQSILSGEAHIAPPQLKRSQAWSHVQVKTSRCLRIMLHFGRGLSLTSRKCCRPPKGCAAGVTAMPGICAHTTQPLGETSHCREGRCMQEASCRMWADHHIYPACQHQSFMRHAGHLSALTHRPSWLTQDASNRSRPSGQMAATVLPQSGSRHSRPHPCR